MIEIDAPRSCTGSPEPCIFAAEGEVVFAYRLASAAFDVEAAEEMSAFVTVKLSRVTKFGSPNDETLHGHRLYSKGLKNYSAFEVLNSSWIAELEIANRVHPYHSRALFEYLHHYIFTFHDSTLELVGDGLAWAVRTGTPGEVIRDEFARRNRNDQAR